MNPEASPGVLAVVPVVVVFLWLELLGGPSSSAPTIHMKFWSNELALYTAVMWEVRLQLAHSVHLNEPITDIFAFRVCKVPAPQGSRVLSPLTYEDCELEVSISSIGSIPAEGEPSSKTVVSETPPAPAQQPVQLPNPSVSEEDPGVMVGP